MVALHQIPPIEQAAALYEMAGLVLARDLEAYLRHPTGRVIKTGDLLLLFRSIRLDDPARWLDDEGEADAWYVHLLIGRPEHALREMPYPLPAICWHRDFRTPGGRLHTVTTDNLIHKLRPYHGR